LGATQIAPDRRAGGRLTRRTAAASVLLSVVIGGAFFLLALAIDALRESKGVAQPEVFGVVAAETGGVLVADCTAVGRFEPDGTATVVGSWDKLGGPWLALALGSRFPAEEASVAGQVRWTRRPAWIRDYEYPGGAAGAWARKHGIRSSVGSPIVVERRLWGVIIAFYRAAGSREGIEGRMLAFTELVAMAVANTESRAQLAASRARVVPNC
jgi:GAF domain-containing protein